MAISNQTNNERERVDQVLSGLEADVENASGDTVASWEGELASHENEAYGNTRLQSPTILDAARTIVDNIPSCKYIFSIIITSCVKKMVEPGQDIRIGQDNLAGGYSNRSFDQRYITPFLKRYNYTHCQASGLESGRNLERPHPWDFAYVGHPRGAGNLEAFKGILHYIQVRGGDPRTVALYMLHYDRSKRASQALQPVAPIEVSISKIMDVLTSHFDESTGQGKSRLPVLALYAVYQGLVDELARYDGAILLPLERHTTADLRSGSIGDIQIDKEDLPFEGVEIKSQRPITADMVMELPRKFDGKKVSRYYILSTNDPYILPEDFDSVERAVQEVESATGAQIIPNGLIRTLWYYLRLLSDPSNIMQNYERLLDLDPDVRPELKQKWHEIISRHYECCDEPRGE